MAWLNYIESMSDALPNGVLPEFVFQSYEKGKFAVMLIKPIW